MTARLRKPRPIPTLEIHRTVRRTNKVIAAAIWEYETMLDAGAAEEAIRQFLASHLYFWNGMLRVGNNLYSKVRLGDEYEIDFVYCDPSSDGAEWHLIEIEEPTAKLITKRGDQSRDLGGARGRRGRQGRAPSGPTSTKRLG